MLAKDQIIVKPRNFQIVLMLLFKLNHYTHNKLFNEKLLMFQIYKRKNKLK